ncbi:inositol monophosphatase [Paracoccus litorisediminis]|uniref:Inositol-1-monophosphatase n=1 Tax=Paracoccus litorisediminis TaxID=2006130 RepID=A0A844HQ01_9RHOB|nr:inositol monophosphatase [Paracoccus litorisediminis]MTH61926.1 inositol monophosphatase [Paracoccus litorisediminis]
MEMNLTDGSLPRMPTGQEIAQRFDGLALIARRAGDAARAAFESRPKGQFTLKGPQDYLTESDAAVEALIRAEIAARWPEDAILGEEGGGTPGPLTWVIDPIDGTANFARGVGHFCVSIAFAIDGRAELGAIVQPLTGEVWLARRGHGATLNGAPLAVRVEARPDQAIIEMGWSRRLPIPGYLAALNHALGQGASVRRVGSGALSLAHVADGRSDGYLEPLMHCWDCLAGLLLVEEAGGLVGDWPGHLADLAAPGPVLAAANPDIFQMLSAARAAGQDASHER